MVTVVIPTRAMARLATEKFRSANSFNGISGSFGLNRCQITKAIRKTPPTTRRDVTVTGPWMTPQSWELASCRPKTMQNSPAPESATPSQSNLRVCCSRSGTSLSAAT